MRLISWNVNGLRACLKNGCLDFIAEKKPDVICLQETKSTAEQVTLPWDHYEQFWNPAERPGYSGTAIFTRIKPLHVMNGMDDPVLDNEGRVITAEFSDFYLVNVYTPNSQRGLSRLAFRTEVWDVAFLNHLKTLKKKKPVVFCGDLNCAHKEIDIANPKANVKNAGFTPQERANFDKIIQAGFVDTFRLFNQSPGQYTWWTYRFNARARNIGWRIDYFLVSEELVPRVKNAEIWSDIKGSDHCPVYLELK